ncbi:MAG: hypothetical protein QW820_06530 [Sulfolobales archaeon]
MGELLILRGETTGTDTSGVVKLDSDVLYSPVDYVRISKGLKCRIWFKKISGEGETLFTLQYTNDVTEATPTWRDMQQEKLASKGELSIEKRRPLVLRGFTGREAFRVVYTQPVAVKAYVELGVEIGDEG